MYGREGVGGGGGGGGGGEAREMQAGSAVATNGGW